MKRLYLLGAISAMIVLAGALLDIVAGTLTGGNLTELPGTAAERYAQIHANPLLGLYNLDMLNMIIQILFIPAWYALFLAHSRNHRPQAALALIVFLTGTVVLVSANAALPIADLSARYFATADVATRQALAAAGEGLLARGTHGSMGAFAGFLLPNIAGFMMSLVMLRSGVFSRTNAWLGILGSLLMVVYLVLVTFVPGAKTMATLIAAPGGLLLMGWIGCFAIRLVKISSLQENQMNLTTPDKFGFFHHNRHS